MPIVPGLAPWSDLASRIAKISQTRPDLAARLIVAPQKAVHAYAIFIQRSGIADDELLATTLFDNHPRDLLDQVWPDRSPELFNLLDRINGPVWQVERYHRLDRLLKSRVAESVKNTTRINEATIIFHEQLEKHDVLVTSAVMALEGRIALAKNLGAIITILRKMNVLSSDEVEAASLKKIRKDGLGRWVERRLRRGIAPTVPLPLSLRQITTCSEMVALGRQMKNCLGEVRSLLALVMGDFVFLRMDDDTGPIVVSLAAGPGGIWMINEAQGSVDRWDDMLIDYVQDTLRAAGLDVVGTTMKGAFQRFSWP